MRKVPVIAIGLLEEEVYGVMIQKTIPADVEIHTVTLYVGPQNQPQYYNDILRLKPKRVIFNPGTENEEFSGLLKAQGVAVIRDCTLIMLADEVY